jgi:hypothetical protein
MFTQVVEHNQKSGRNKFWILPGAPAAGLESVIYNGHPGAHDAAAFGETDMPRAGQLSEDNVMAKKSKVKSAAKKRPAAKKKKK